MTIAGFQELLNDKETIIAIPCNITAALYAAIKAVLDILHPRLLLPAWETLTDCCNESRPEFPDNWDESESSYDDEPGW
jgi:hypothetical protein